MHDYTGCVVRATAGRDAEGLFFVTGMQGEYLLMCDGKRRKVEKPKKKKLVHVCVVDVNSTLYQAISVKLKKSEPISDRALRRALAAIKEGIIFG